MNETIIESFAHYEQVIDELNSELESNREHPNILISSPLFRGHSNSAWSLDTTLERFLPNQDISIVKYNSYISRIRHSVESLLEVAWEFDDNPELPKDFYWEAPPNYPYMVYLRHHGFPSPLLDWSVSPYVALFFALKNLDSTSDAAVFVCVPRPLGGKGGRSGDPEITDIGHYVKAHRRHVIQQSRYTMCVQLTDSKWNYKNHHLVFDKGDKRQDFFMKLIIQKEHRLEYLRKLDLMNVNAYTLFGTEDSLMHSLSIREPFKRTSI